jgi:hypothetical protein
VRQPQTPKQAATPIVENWVMISRRLRGSIT